MKRNPHFDLLHFPQLKSKYLYGAVVRNPPAKAGDKRDVGLIPASGRSPGVRNGNPLQYSCLGDPMVRGACRLQSMGSQRVRHD